MTVVVVREYPKSTKHLMAASIMSVRVAALFWACQPVISGSEASICLGMTETLPVDEKKVKGD